LKELLKPLGIQEDNYGALVDAVQLNSAIPANGNVIIEYQIAFKE